MAGEKKLSVLLKSMKPILDNDHLFIPSSRANESMEILERISKESILSEK
jgi:hypothetical protein